MIKSEDQICLNQPSMPDCNKTATDRQCPPSFVQESRSTEQIGSLEESLVLASTLWASAALTESGWRPDVLVQIDQDGRIANIKANSNRPTGAIIVDVLLPAPANLHSHAFQRAMAGLAESRGPNEKDSFWTWRELMYRFLNQLDPDDIQSITAMVQMQMLETGFAAVAEFHYLHHQPNGRPYDRIDEMSQRIAAAAEETGIGLTLLPVLYQVGGCDGRALGSGQVRFGNNLQQFASLVQSATKSIAGLPNDCRIGVAPHSLRATSQAGIREAVALAGKNPLHLHLAEQTAEVEEVLSYRGQRPVRWLFDHFDVDDRWCLIHCTQLEPDETTLLANSAAVVGLCPITEANLGDGIFDGAAFVQQGGRWGIGSDSNVRISLTEELRTLEYSQRLRDHLRAVLATKEKSSGRFLFEGILSGGRRALGRNSGRLMIGNWADLMSLDLDKIDPVDPKEINDRLLDRWIFVAGDKAVDRVWSAGRMLVQQGKHIDHHRIEQRFRQTMRKLTDQI